MKAQQAMRITLKTIENLQLYKCQHASRIQRGATGIGIQNARRDAPPEWSTATACTDNKDC